MLCYNILKTFWDRIHLNFVLVIHLLNDHDFDDINIDILDSEISKDEIIKAIKKLKSGKSTGNDNIIGEMVTACPLFFAPIFKKLFNTLFSNGTYPESWTECIIIPVPKSGDLTEPNNYRTMVLVSVLSKLFTSILTDRLLSWSEDEDKLIDNQFGFRSDKSTIDAIFTLHGIISHQLENKEKLFYAFVDFPNVQNL